MKFRATIATTITAGLAFPTLSVAQTGREDLINQPLIEQLGREK